MPYKFVTKTKRGEYWVLLVGDKFAVGKVKGHRVLVDGCERFDDPIDAQILAMQRATS